MKFSALAFTMFTLLFKPSIQETISASTSQHGKLKRRMKKSSKKGKGHTTATPTSAPTATTTSTPTAKPTSAPTATPTSAPTGSPVPTSCQDNPGRFLVSGTAGNGMRTCNWVNRVPGTTLYPWRCSKYPEAAVNCRASCGTCVSSTEAPTVCPNFGTQTPLESSSITLGEDFTCAITDGGSALECWGANSSGQLGDGTFVDKNTPTIVSLGTTFPQAKQIVAGRSHMCAIDNGDNLKCWGSNGYGQVRNTLTYGDSSVNSPFLVLSDVTHVSPATTLTCMIDKSNNFHGLGSTTHGQFGDGELTSYNDDPTIIIPGTSSSYATQITSGILHTCMIDSCNVLKCMGDNYSGQLGTGTNGSYRAVPTTIIDSTASYYITQVSAGSSHTCAIDNTNNLYCWGFNSSGQLGDGTTNNSDLPKLITLVPGGAPFLVTQVSAGSSHTCAIDITDNLYCWGNNSVGQLGDSTTGNKNLPTLITISASSPPTAITQIGTGRYHTCAIDDVNDLYCWGKNDRGQIGNGTTGGNVLSPTKITTV